MIQDDTGVRTAKEKGMENASQMMNKIKHNDLWLEKIRQQASQMEITDNKSLQSEDTRQQGSHQIVNKNDDERHPR